MRFNDVFVMAGTVVRERKANSRDLRAGIANARDVLKRIPQVGDSTIWPVAKGLQLEVQRGLPIQIFEDPEVEALAQSRMLAFGELDFEPLYWMAVAPERASQDEIAARMDSEAVEAIIAGSLRWGSPGRAAFHQTNEMLKGRRPLLISTLASMEGSPKLADLAGSVAAWLAGAVMSTSGLRR